MYCSVKIVLYFQKHTDASVFVINDTFSGYCCNDKLSADHVIADACVHFGPACLTCSDSLPTFYMFSKTLIDVDEFCEAFYKKFQDFTAKILIFYDTSFAYCIGKYYFYPLQIKYWLKSQPKSLQDRNFELS